ncbi:MAG: hypothetical protein SVR04_16370 [Spirochaetota bacterium]|nr:hypothetical protein [Spirochaetota bacterium]
MDKKMNEKQQKNANKASGASDQQAPFQFAGTINCRHRSYRPPQDGEQKKHHTGSLS